MPIPTDIENHQERFIEFHKKKKSHWLLVSILVLLIALFTFVYAFQAQSKYKKITLSANQKEEVKLSEDRSETNIKMIEDVRNTQLFFQNEKQVFRKSPLDALPEQILLADTYAVSADGEKIAFFRGEMADNNGYFAVLDLTTKKETEYKLKEYETLRGLEWSPDDKFILINYGTSMYGSTYIYDLSKKIEIGSFGQYRDNLWIDNNRAIVSQASSTIKNRFVESGYGSDIVEISIKNPENPKMILSADLKRDYYSIKIDNNCLVVKIDSVENEKDWEKEGRDSKIKSAYKCYNLTDKSMTAYDYNQDTDKLVINQIIKALMLEDDRLAYVYLFNSDLSSKYKIAYVRKGSGSIYDGEIFLVDPTNVSDSLFLLGQGTNVFWKNK